MDGRDPEVMDMLLTDARDAVWGFPVKFESVPFDTPLILVQICGEPTGSISWMPEDLCAEGKKDKAGWWNVSTLTPMTTSTHGESLRAALAAHLNAYIDKVIGVDEKVTTN